jgi:hypothetical protein
VVQARKVPLDQECGEFFMQASMFSATAVVIPVDSGSDDGAAAPPGKFRSSRAMA